jgi:hypothetical protein
MFKTNFVTVGLILLLFVFTTSCNQNKNNANSDDGKDVKTEQLQNEDELHEEHAAKYLCPMKCEGEKTYDEPGTCPRCKMDLEEVESV